MLSVSAWYLRLMCSFHHSTFVTSDHLTVAVYCLVHRILGGRVSGIAAGHGCCANRVCSWQCHVEHAGSDVAAAEVSVSTVCEGQFRACDSATVSIRHSSQLHLLCHADCPRSRL